LSSSPAYQQARSIAARASTLYERLGPLFVAGNGGVAGDVAVDARQSEWLQAVAGSDAALWQARLTWDGFTIDSARRALGAVRLREDAPLPAWIHTLIEVCDLYPTPSTHGPRRERDWPFLDPEKPLPFEEVVAPFVQLARQRCVTHAGAAYHLLSDLAHRSLERHLLHSLGSYAAQTLYLVFSIERAHRHILPEKPQTPSPSRAFYDDFVGRMNQGQLLTLFHTYPVLARLLATLTDRWVEASVEFLQQLAADLPDLQRIFGGDLPLGVITALELGLSDPHRGRRTVMTLRFASGLKLVYKPKDVSLEEAFQRLLAWCNTHGTLLRFRTLTMLNRSSHGWVECADLRSCADQQAAQRYFRRAGMLLCLIYVLDGTDFHCDNLIADGEYPLLIDLETLLQPRPLHEERLKHALSSAPVGEQLAHSVLQTDLLPYWHVRTAEGQQVAFDISGLTGVGEQPLLRSEPLWEFINTDRMTMRHRQVETRSALNLPMFAGNKLRVHEYADELIAGFRQMYRLLLTHRQALLAPAGPLSHFSHQQVRFIFRGTRVYSAFEQKLLAPKYLRDGVDRGLQLEYLARALLDSDTPASDQAKPPNWWSIYAAEREALEQADIPYFTAMSWNDSLSLAPGQEIAHCFEGPSFEHVLTRLNALCEEDLDLQVSFIEGALCAHVAHAATARPPGARTRCVAQAKSSRPTSSETQTLEETALAIAEQIARRALRMPGRGVTWMAPQYLPGVDRYQFQPCGYDFYDGASGPALFLAAVERITGGAGFREMILAAIEPLRRALRSQGARMARVLGIGGVSGLGSLVYALTSISRFLQEPRLLEDAQLAAQLITDEALASDRALDVSAGSAGALLGLLLLYELQRDQTILDRAIACGRHLLRSRVQSPSGPRAWPTLSDRLLTGFSHGVAGIAYALLRLFAATRDETYRQAVEEGIAYEDSLFVPEIGNWPDLRAEAQPAFMTSWCHGAPGIGLARVGGLPWLDTGRIREDIAAAMQTTQRVGLGGQDHLCCGNLGRVECLLAASEALAMPEWAEIARTHAYQVAAEARQAQGYFLFPCGPSRVDTPSFFRGTAGIGYALLRLAHPGKLPCALLWQ
jgi:class II lanthipeptide synthase